MTVLMITLWLALQIPAGIAIGRMLQHGRVPVRARVRARARR